MTTLQLISDSSKSCKRVWEFGFNTCHAPMVMRSDLQQHMQRAVRELKHRYWRCHGTLSDDVGIYAKDFHGNWTCHFSGLKRIVDAALSTGVLPFFELSAMPRALAREPEARICFYDFCSSPPRDFAHWGDLVEQTVRFLVNTYGVESVRTWYFEVWNEPNIPFWTGTQAEYFELYAHSAQAVKRVDSQIRIGGPATARGEWISDFLEFCQETKTPVDFLSTHIYPSDVAFVDSAEGEVNLQGMGFLYRHFARVKREVEASGFDLPIFWGEWNSSAGPFADNHDDCNNAALIVGALAAMERFADGSLFWNLSDIYEECQYHFTPFHGGYGLYTVDDLPKSAARAMELLTHLQSRVIEVENLDPDTPERGALATQSVDGRNQAVIFWHHREPGVPPTSPDWEVVLELPQGSPSLPWEMIALLPGQGSCYETWLEMGSPSNLSRAQHKALQKASEPQAGQLEIVDGRIKFSVPSGSVVLVRNRLAS